MKKIAAIFVLAVLAPSLALAWLGVRSLRNQEMIVQSQRALLLQGTTDNLAVDVNVVMDDFRFYFRNKVDELLGSFESDELVRDFDRIIRTHWSQAAVGSVVSEDGKLLSPSKLSPDPRIQMFCTQNGGFLSNTSIEEVYRAAPNPQNLITIEPQPEEGQVDATMNDKPGGVPLPSQSQVWRMEKGKREAVYQAPVSGDEREAGVLEMAAPQQTTQLQEKVALNNGKLRSRYVAGKTGVAAPTNEEDASLMKMRNLKPLSQVEVQQGVQDNQALEVNEWSAVMPQRGEFFDLIGDGVEGVFSRFLQNELHILLWYRPESFKQWIFCTELDLDMIKTELGKVVSELRPEGKGKDDACLALLDDGGRPVATSLAGFTTNWSAPFVASEVGQILPHWEVAAYLTNPGALNQMASGARLTLGLLILVLIAAIGFGSLLIFLDLNREMKLARQKTDFVSNVSHELKTPLTSIRMFSELLSGPSSKAEGKREEYAGVIHSEASRLGRLINNLLDFSRLERGEARYDFGEVDLGEVARELAEHVRPQFEEEGVSLAVTRDDCPAGECLVHADRDAVSQVIINLFSNAQKYGGGGEVSVELERADGAVELRVLDRGTGVTRRDQQRIFEKFYRTDDSLSAAAQGSGLGLTLARQIARKHGGDVVYRDRPGGGSCFVFSLPMALAEHSIEKGDPDE